MNQICAKDFNLWNLHTACQKGKDIEECKRCWTGALKWHKPEEPIEPWPEPIDEGMPVEKAVELLNNHRTCLYPGKFAEKNCEGCMFYEACAFEGKGNYKAYKL